MRIPEVYTPGSLEEALELKSLHGADLPALAGGTDLIPGLRSGAVAAGRLLDLSCLDGLDSIEEKRDEVLLGALLTHASLAGSSIVRERLSILAEACGSMGSVQIRNVGTVGGNLANASPAADSIPPLRVLGATCMIRSKAGMREVPLGSFFTGPGETVLSPDEILAGIRVKKAPENARCFYLKLGQRRAMAIAKVSVALLAVWEGRILTDVRIALGAVAPTVVGAPQTARFLDGKGLDGDVIAEAARIVETEASPITDVRSTAEYRRRMVGALLARGLRGFLE